METTSSSPRREPFVVAHRGGNRLDSLRTAERLGIPLVEADLRLFHGRIEVRHVKSVGPLPLFWDRWKVAAPWTRHLTLEELLRSTSEETELMLDLKGRRVELGRRVAALIRPSLPERSFTICAREPRLLEPLSGLPVRRFVSIGSARQLRRLLREEAAARLDGVSIHARLLNAEVVRELRRVADVVLTWPVNRLDVAQRVRSLGIDGLITDVPELLLASSVRT